MGFSPEPSISTAAEIITAISRLTYAETIELAKYLSPLSPSCSEYVIAERLHAQVQKVIKDKKPSVVFRHGERMEA